MIRVKSRGFTMIELVLVIVILGILAATALPKFVQLQDDAREAAAKGELGALRAAAAMYYASTAIKGGTAVYPGTKAALIAQLAGPLTALYPANSTYRWSYNSTTGQVSQSGW